MGKTQLKKELQQLNREQLEQLLLDAYEAKKEIKQYFDFFLNPDVAKLLDRYKSAIDKELKRSKRGHSRMRTSVVKRLIKEFCCFQPGFEYEIDLMFHAISAAMLAERDVDFSEAQCKAFGRILLDLIAIADRNLMADKVLCRISDMLNCQSAGSWSFRRYLRKLLDESL